MRPFPGGPALPGLIVQRFLDQLSGNAPADFSLWTLLALLVGVGVIRVVELSGGKVQRAGAARMLALKDGRL